MKCKYCGKDLIEGSTFCDGCGSKVEVETITEPVISNPTPNKGGSKTIIIILTVLVLILIAVIIFLLSGNSSSSNNGTNTNNTNTNTNTDNGNTNTTPDPTPTPPKPNEDLEDYLTEEQAQEIIDNLEEKIECFKDRNEHVQCLINVKNNSNRTANVVMSEIQFYDKEGNSIGFANGPCYSNGLGAGKAGFIYAYDVKYFNRENPFAYDHYEISYYLQGWFVARDHRDEVTITELESKDNSSIILKAKNNSKDTIDHLKVMVIYYKDDKIVNVNSTINFYKNTDFDNKEERKDEIAPGEELYSKIVHDSYYENDEIKIIDYDRYELIIHDAYTKIKEKK